MPVFVRTFDGLIAAGVGRPIGSELVVHGCSREWRITHRASGRRVATFKSRKSAKKAAAAIAPMFLSAAGVFDIERLRRELDKTVMLNVLREHGMLW